MVNASSRDRSYSSVEPEIQLHEILAMRAWIPTELKNQGK